MTWRERVLARPTYAFRALAAIGAIAITLLGAAPMALAATNPHADPILNEAIDGTPVSVNLAAAPFTLTDQNGATVSLAEPAGSRRGARRSSIRCARRTARSSRRSSTTPIACSGHSQDTPCSSPSWPTRSTTRSPSRVPSIRPRVSSGVKNWLFLTGPEPTLKRLWSRYGVQVSVEPAGAMVAHSDIAFVIDATGRTRYVLNADPGPGTAASQSSFSGVVTMEIRRVLGAS